MNGSEVPPAPSLRPPLPDAKEPGAVMTTERQKTEFVFEAGKVLPPLCHRCVTRVVAVRTDGSFEHRGTALMCLFDDRQAFVTALHVITDIEEDDGFRTFGFGAKSEDGYVDIIRFSDVDIAVVIPMDDFEPKDNHEFWLSRQSDDSSQLLAQDYLLIHGYSDQFTHYTSFLPGFVAEAYTHCALIRPRESEFSEEALAVVKQKFPNYLPVPDVLMRPTQFAINYAEDTGPLKTAEGKEVTNEGILKDYSTLFSDGVALPGQIKHGAFGLSGSPVWRFGAYECGWYIEDWRAECVRLAGIVTDWNEGHQILIATPFGEIVARLNQ